ncbi:peptidyl-prolyl cis-trans isomerase [Nematocida ausubeli]|uniref:peptidylprolyl isomerase n=1 Tax=Nematocida ausubeli (strain ATCC PRA-371 / ERTm2) TaxID=1913371 RepID=H8ZAY2_NEMA1|nr:peptidyl-prolyl cis-trans isomerase [Nematocida ausubeli]
MHKGIEVLGETVFKTSTETLLNDFTLIKKDGSKTKTSLIAEDIHGNRIILCTLVPGVNESIVANTILQPGEIFKLSSTTNNAVHISYLESEYEKVPSETTSLVTLRIKEHEKVFVTGPTVYSLVSIVSCASERLSLCLLVNGEEITLANLVPNRIETAEISLETFEDAELQLFIVGKGEVEIVGYAAPEEDSEEEDCYECGLPFEECDCEDTEEIEESDEINDNDFISDEKMEHIMGVAKKNKTPGRSPQELKTPEKKLSKEEKKLAERQKDLKDIKIVDTFKSKQKKVAQKTDKVKIKYTLFVNNKMVEKNKSSGLVFRMGDGQIIRGLELGIEGMHVGSKRTITIPPHLGYGSVRVGGIPPNSVLVFQVELCCVID